MTPLFVFFFFNVFTSALFFVVPFDRDADRGTDRVVRTDCAYVVRTGAPLYVLTIRTCGFYHTYIHTYIHTFTYLSTCMSIYVYV